MIQKQFPMTLCKNLYYSLSVRCFSLSITSFADKKKPKKTNDSKKKDMYRDINSFKKESTSLFGPLLNSSKNAVERKRGKLDATLDYYRDGEYYSIAHLANQIIPQKQNFKKVSIFPVRKAKAENQLKNNINKNSSDVKTVNDIKSNIESNSYIKSDSEIKRKLKSKCDKSGINFKSNLKSNPAVTVSLTNSDLIKGPFTIDKRQKKLSITESLQTIASYPLSGNPEKKLPYVEHLQPLLTALPREPSVGNILRETMSEQSKAALDRWMKKKIKELGAEGFEQYKQGLFSTGSNFHSCIAAKLQNKPEIPLQPKTEPLWESVESVFKDISEVEMVEARTTHKELGYMGILDGVIRYRDELVLVDWKTSDREKTNLEATYDDPVQVLAYMGAVNSDSTHNINVNDGLLVVAYRDGHPADILKIPSVLCHMYWKKWLARLYKYWSFRLT